MSNRALLQRFDAVLQSVGEPLVRQYLEEAHRCFAAGAYNGATIAGWSALIAHFRGQVDVLEADFFQYCFRRAFPDRKKIPNTAEDLLRKSDQALIRVCAEMRILTIPGADLHQFREARHKCAHPTGEMAKRQETERRLWLCLSIVGQLPSPPLVRDSVILTEFALASDADGESYDATSLVRWMQPKERLKAAQNLLKRYVNSNDPECENIPDVWRVMWSLLDAPDQRRLWRALALEVVRVVNSENEFRIPREIADLIAWPDADIPHLYRDFIADNYIRWFNDRLGNKLIETDDEKFAQRLYEKVSARAKKQIHHTLTRWIIHRVRKGDFDGQDLDFVLWLKRRSSPHQLGRFEVILQRMCRRYTDE